LRIAAFTLALAVLATGCGDFEAPSIVLDLRVLGGRAEPPEVVSPVDPDNPMDLELVEVQVCGLVADPGDDRRLQFEMVACAPTDTKRCDELDRPFVDLGFGTTDDPETAATEVQICGTVPAGGGLLAVLEDSIRGDALSGFGGIEVQVEIAVRPDGAPLADAQFAAKTVLYSPQFPEERVANTNPRAERFTAAIDGADPIDLPLGRCAEIAPMQVAAGAALELEPVEADGVREDYVVPTFDGGSRMFTENLTYAWYATHGEWSRENTGGPRDFAGNQPPLDTTWTAPTDPEVVGTGLDVALWLVQRDERGGQRWYHSCLRVMP
jgi:hypothetical protein